MKNVLCSLLVIGLLSAAGFTGAKWSQAAEEMESLPIQQVMLERAGWLAAITENMATTNYDEVKRDAAALASQARAQGEKINDSLFKELTMKLATKAAALADAAGTQDAATARTQLAEVRATCGECHAKFNNN